MSVVMYVVIVMYVSINDHVYWYWVQVYCISTGWIVSIVVFTIWHNSLLP